ncbi:MAG: gliding motility-associated C-terminal domain-containing protein [Lishizhenia sp.]
MKTIYTLFITAFLMVNSAISQIDFCSVTIQPNDTTICFGDTVCLVAEAYLVNGNNAYDFNSGTPPVGWNVGGNSSVGQPCDPSLDGTDYYWAATAGSTTPQITTNIIDVTCGGLVIFDYVNSVQSSPAPCEGPDLADEGVEIQYSVNGGNTWSTFAYMQPDGQILPGMGMGTFNGVGAGQGTPFTTWSTYQLQIPAVAQGPNTSFRWIQQNSSGANFDNWGLDNIIINSSSPPCDLQTAVVNWSTGGLDTLSACVVPLGDTTIFAYVYDTLGNYQCETSVDLSVFADNMTYNLIDTVVSPCPGTGIPVQVTSPTSASASNSSGFAFEWENLGSSNPITLPTGTLEQEEIWYNVLISDLCYNREDSVLLIVNQTLNIDTIYSQASNACDPTGFVSAVIVGETNASGQSDYNWSGPGVNSPNSIDGTAWNNLSSGWYYFTVEDDVCDDLDSAFIDILEPPTAVITPSTTSGCIPLTVTFENDSYNTNNYRWDFGDGNPISINNESSQTFTFYGPTTVELIAFTSPDENCGDTTTVFINLEPCGCTDPQATNYSEFATIDDGSCTYPIPQVEAPNVFSPNGDDANEIYELTLTNTQSVKLTIVNRWGVTVFEEKSANPKWDGKDKNTGTPVVDGTYFYTYEAEGVDGTKATGQGFIQVYVK